MPPGLITDNEDEFNRLIAPASPVNPIVPPSSAPSAPMEQGTLMTAEQQAQSPEVQKAAAAFAEQIPRGGMMGDLLQQLPMAMQPASFLGNLGLNTVTGAGVAANAPGSTPESIATGAALGGGIPAVLQSGGQFLRYLGSAIPKKAFDAAQEAKIGDWLKQRVPWWNDLSVSEMATSGKAKDALKQGYEDAFTAARDQIPEDAKASIPIDIANALKLKGEGGLDARFLSPKVMQMLEKAGKVGADALDTVAVNARDLLDKLPGSEGQIRAQILRGLDPVAGNVIPEAREAFKTGRGWQELANRGGIGKAGVFDAQTAQEALLKPMRDQSLAQKALQPRGMGELEDIIKGPLKEPITSQTPPSLAWHLGLGGAGILGGLMGTHGLHGLGGGAAALLPRPTFYKNVPPMLPQAGPMAQQGLRMVMPGFLSNMSSSERD